MADEFLTKEAADQLYLSLTGGTLRGALILPITAPTHPYQATTMTWVESTNRETVAHLVRRAGDAMTGPLGLPGDPTADLHAASKHYVDNSKGSGSNIVALVQRKDDVHAPQWIHVPVFDTEVELPPGRRIARLTVSGGCWLLDPIPTVPLPISSYIGTLSLSALGGRSQAYYIVGNQAPLEPPVFASGSITGSGATPGWRFPPATIVYVTIGSPDYYLTLDEGFADDQGNFNLDIQSNKYGGRFNLEEGTELQVGAYFGYLPAVVDPPGITGGSGLFSASLSAAAFLGSVEGGRQRVTLEFASSHPNINICGTNGLAPDLAWMLMVEDLGAAP